MRTKQAREASQGYEASTNDIKRVVQEATKPNHNEIMTEISPKEIKEVTKNLKKKKSNGPDDIPNEIIIEADDNTREIYRRVFNHILTTKEVPESWQLGEITRLYKGKGTKGKCSNELGITVASNMGKFFERIINDRALKEAIITDAQAGGKKGRATTDHLLVLKETIKQVRHQKKTVYLAFLDVTKAYDKAWLDGILYVLQKHGVKGNLLRIIK
jgi:hypothetical protein